MASAADERHILDELRHLQDQFSRGEAEQATAALHTLFDRYSRPEVELFRLLGPRALYGDN
ncbi:hypothetical protein [Nocardia sp. NPDC004860]|uniref:hypothetical protein n=1 Tax=Nocardia sp. NPDC004860 TaxID=3154557 RepID=UPI0033B9C3B4